MNFSSNSNIYAFNATSVLGRFAPYIEGNDNCLIAVISTSPLIDAARFALERSADQLGYGAARIAYITCAPAPEHETLDGEGLCTILEGLDPSALIITDRDALRLLETDSADRIEPDCVGRLAGRTIIAFADFAAMLKTDQDKQRAWANLKSLALE